MLGKHLTNERHLFEFLKNYLKLIFHILNKKYIYIYREREGGGCNVVEVVSLFKIVLSSKEHFRDDRVFATNDRVKCLSNN